MTTRRRTLLLGPLLLLLAHAAPAGERPVWSHALSEGATVEVRDDATLVVRDGDVVLLNVAAGLRLSRAQRRSDDRLFSARCREGDEHGRRGFSERADDDGDGRVDEDPLDGRDDDGDGRVDEDFAAIGDDMAAVSFQRNGRALFLETYHWNYPHLHDTLFTSWRRASADGEPRSDRVRLDLPAGVWREMSIGWGGPLDVADRTMMVASLPRDGGRRWIGVTLPDTVRSGDEPRLEDGRLDLSLDGDLVCAIGVTSTLTQLRRSLAMAHAVYAGAPAGPDLPAVPWIVPPLQHCCYAESPLAATWARETGGWRLELEIPDGGRALPDPETLCLDDVVLGAPISVSWRPTTATGDDAKPWSASWPSNDLDSLWRAGVDRQPYLDACVSGGMLTFHYSGAPVLGAEDRLSGETVCGQIMLVESAAAAVEIASATLPEADVGGEQDLERHPPALSPELLDTYPNPFRQITRLRYSVPATIGEAFVWEEDEEPPLEATAAVPYTSGTPSVSLRVYTVAGHEVATLFDGICAIGSYETTWDGTDSLGRPVAVGTYFCKLQIENWSVTKRVALLR